MVTPDYLVHDRPRDWRDAQHGLCSRCERTCPVHWNWGRQQWLCNPCRAWMTKHTVGGTRTGRRSMHPCEAPYERTDEPREVADENV